MTLEIALKNITFIDVVIIVVFIAALVLCAAISIMDKKEKRKTETAELFYRFIQYAIEALPLLGTLVGLINNSVNADALQSNFLYALTSTFWGLVGAIVVKFIDTMWISKIMQRQP